MWVWGAAATQELQQISLVTSHFTMLAALWTLPVWTTVAEGRILLFKAFYSVSVCVMELVLTNMGHHCKNFLCLLVCSNQLSVISRRGFPIADLLPYKCFEATLGKSYGSIFIYFPMFCSQAPGAKGWLNLVLRHFSTSSTRGWLFTVAIWQMYTWVPGLSPPSSMWP